MGCISVTVCIENNGASANITGTKTPVNIVTQNLNVPVEITTSFIPQTLNVQVSLVCQTTTGEYELLRVAEGNIITIDGQYIRVLRNGV